MGDRSKNALPHDSMTSRGDLVEESLNCKRSLLNRGRSAPIVAHLPRSCAFTRHFLHFGRVVAPAHPASSPMLHPSRCGPEAGACPVWRSTDSLQRAHCPHSISDRLSESPFQALSAGFSHRTTTHRASLSLQERGSPRFLLCTRHERIRKGPQPLAAALAFRQIWRVLTSTEQLPDDPTAKLRGP